MSQNNYFKMIVAYPVMICLSVLCQGVVGCEQLPFLERVPKGPTLFKINNKLEHVVRKDVKNREKLTFQQVYTQETIF